MQTKEQSKLTLTKCSRGHVFQKSTAQPVCPTCWPGFYKKRAKQGIPSTLSAPAIRTLANANITTLAQLAKKTESEVAELHGIGPSALKSLRSALKVNGLSFKK